MLQDMLLRLRLLSALRRSRIDCLVVKKLQKRSKLIKKYIFKDIKMPREPQEIHKFHMRNVEMFLISKEIWRNLTLESHTLQIPTSHAWAMHEPCTSHARSVSHRKCSTSSWNISLSFLKLSWGTECHRIHRQNVKDLAQFVTNYQFI